MENPIKMDDLGVPLFLETPMYFLLNMGIFQPAHVSLPEVVFESTHQDPKDADSSLWPGWRLKHF